MTATTSVRTPAPAQSTQASHASPSRALKGWQAVDSLLPELTVPFRLGLVGAQQSPSTPLIVESPVVLVYGASCGHRTAFLRCDPSTGENSWLTTDSEEWDISAQVTHWMPLPALPKVAVAVKDAPAKATPKEKAPTLAERATALATSETPATRTAARKASAQRQAAKTGGETAVAGASVADKAPATKTVRAGKSGRVKVAELPPTAGVALPEAATGA